MARRTKQAADDGPVLPEGLIDQLAQAVQTPADFQAIYRQFQKALTERVLQAELTQHLGYPEGAGRAPDGNARNGTTPKTITTDTGTLELAIPRDRQSSFQPQFVPKGVRRLPGFDETVLALYARGLTVRELQAYLEERYQVPVSPDLISTVTAEVLEEVQTWQGRPLEPRYIAVAFDALRVKIRDEGLVQNKAVYLALGVQPDGTKEILGFWIAQTEGAAFWHRVFSELQSRGVGDILIALIDGLTGLPEALHAVFPQTVIHQCVVHLVRQSLQYVSYQDRKALVPLLRAIYQAPSETSARAALTHLASTPLGQRYPQIAPIWERHWARIAPALAYPLAVRRVLYTTNAIESLNSQLRKPLKARGHFPNDDAAAKLLYLALRNIQKTWRAKPAQQWRAALPHLKLLFGDRVPNEL
ncbi:MAG: IS256 family transposase [Gemmatimonadetes bacterium]|jgi:putative transposase|nr:IS256 family transposase [Gemmatimonadota bacterium]